MKVLMLSRDTKGVERGSATFSRWQSLAAQDIELKCIVSSSFASEEKEGRVWAKSTGGSGVWQRYWRMWKLAKAWARDVDLITAQDPFELGLIAWIVGRSIKKPVEIQDHGGFFDGKPNGEPFWPIRKYLAYWLARRATAIRTVSPGSHEKLTSQGFGPKTVLLPINVDTRFAHAEYAPVPHHVVTVSRLVAVKRLSLSLEVFAAYLKLHPEARYTIIGDGPEKASLLQKAGQLQIASAVDFVGEQDPLPFLEKAACFLFLSQHEGWGIAPAEAATVGVPIVMTETGCGPLLTKQGAARLVHEEKISSIVGLMEEAVSQKGQSQSSYVVDYAGTYVHHWHEMLKPRILVMVQAVDPNDPLMGFFIDWLRAASKEFSEITVLALRVAEVSIADTVRVIPLRPKGSSSKILVLWNAWRCSWYWRHAYQGVYVRGDIQYILGCAWIWRLLGKRIVLWFAHFKPHRALSLAASLADIVATSVPEACAYEGKKRRLIGQAIDPSLFPLQTKGEGMKILVFGRVSEAKRILELVQDLKTMAVPGMEVDIIGKALNHAYRSAISSALQGSTNIHWKEQDMPFAELPAMFKGYDILLNATQGSLDKVILEAALSGLIPVAETGGVESFLPSPYAFLRAQSREERKRALEKIAGMRGEERRKMAQEIAQAVIKHHSVGHQLEELKNIFAIPYGNWPHL